MIPQTPRAKSLPLREVQEAITAEARTAGLTRAGIAAVPSLDDANYQELDYVADWVGRGYAGEMDYLKRRDDRNRLLRSSLCIPFPWVRSVIVCAANYQADAVRSIDPAPSDRGWIARYAWTGFARNPGAEDAREFSSGNEAGAWEALEPSDYHTVLLRRLKNLDQALQTRLGTFESRCFVDTGPVVERAYAKYAGIGWIGKNTCMINQEIGSWLFLGVILTSLEVPGLDVEALSGSSSGARATIAADRCGSCTRCIEACPTGALVAPYKMDASLCIAYLTIEKRGPIPEQLRSQIGRQVFGCDICQEVCPWNRRAPISGDPELAVRDELVNPALNWLAELSPESFRRLFRHSAVSRAKLPGLLRNVAIAMGNSGLDRYLPKLREWSTGTDPVLAEAALWATRQIEGQEPRPQSKGKVRPPPTETE